MRIFAALALAALALPASAQTAPAAGDVVDSIEMIGDRTVYFEPTADGKLKLVRVHDKSRSMPVLKEAGQVGMSMTFAQEIGSVLEFNSGLDYGFDYTVSVVTPQGLKPLTACPVGKGLVAAEQWPEPYGRLVISGFKRSDAPLPPEC